MHMLFSISVAFTLVKRPGYWDNKDLNFIIDHGDKIFKSLMYLTI